MQRGFLGGLLGAAAGLAFVPAAQAADLPVKAKPVEYVKVCSAYGAGFYYIPGTDICLRVGGYVFLETGVKGAAAAVDIIYPAAGAGATYGDINRWSDAGIQFNRNDAYSNWRARGMVILDARNNTAYGTLRAYTVFGLSNAGGATSPSLDRAFIQFAGFTAGYTESFFSFGGAYSIVASASLSWDWLPLIAYTAQLGNGVSATLSVEDPAYRRTGIAPNNTLAAATAYGYGGTQVPDIIANVRVDQSWGSAQIMGAVKELRTNVAAANAGYDTEFGYAVGAGIEIKTPQTGNPNNSLLLQGVWSKGAVEYTGLASSPATTAGFVGFVKGATGAGSLIFDAVPITGTTTLDRTKAWSAYAGYRHYWTPSLRTGFAAGVTDIDYSAAARASANVDDVRVWQGFVSTIWSPVANLDLSLDIVYSNVKSGPCGTGAFPAVPTTECPGKEDVWTAWTRIRRNF